MAKCDYLNRRFDVLRVTFMFNFIPMHLAPSNMPFFTLIRYFLVCLVLLVSNIDCLNITNTKSDKDVIDNYTKPLRIAENSLQMSIMEKILDIYVFSNSSNETCRLHSLEYRDALMNYEPWALKMFDASTKFQSGIIAGDIMDFGSYTQCVKIKTTSENVGVINGKLCTFGVLLPEELLKKMFNYRGIDDVFYENVKEAFDNSLIEWSICVPNACGQDDVVEHFRDKLNELFDGLNMTIEEKVECSTLAEAEKEFTGMEISVFAFVALLFLVVVVSTVVDIYKRYNEDEDHGFETVFSMIANTRYIIAKNKSHQNMACLNGIRALSIIFVIFGHRYLMILFFASANMFEFLDWLLNYSSQLITGGTVSVDSFLLLSAVLLTYHFLINHHKGGKFNLLLYYLHRYLRLTPSYAFTILIIVTFGHRFGMGPKWASSADAIVQPCKDHWWSALLYIQSYVNPKDVCILQSWYLSIDMFYYVFAPLLLIPLAKYEIFGLINIFVVYVAAVAANFVLAYKNEYVVHSLIDNKLPSSDYFTQHYTQPHVRASPYILGIVFGYILFKFRNKKVKMSFWTVVFGWIASLTVIATVVLTNRVFLDPEYVYDRLGSSLYIAINRSVWVIALAWIIWACVHGYGGPVNTFLSNHFFAVLAKLTYSAYLVHMQIQYFDNGASKLPNYFSNLTLIRKGFGDVAVAFLLGYFLTILIECPVYRLSLMLLKTDTKKVEQTENQS